VQRTALSTPGAPSHKPILTSTLFFVFGKAARSAIKPTGKKCQQQNHQKKGEHRNR
jgi:hypothetical protein